MTLGIDECAFPNNAPTTGFNYGCRCRRCTAARKRYDGARDPRARVQLTFADERRYVGPCRCPEPTIIHLGIFGCDCCGDCGMPMHDPRKESHGHHPAQV